MIMSIGGFRSIYCGGVTFLKNGGTRFHFASLSFVLLSLSMEALVVFLRVLEGSNKAICAPLCILSMLWRF